MSGFADISSAYSQFHAAGNWDNVNYGLIYTCNAGWIDLGHLNPNSSRKLIGASNLWARIKVDGPRALKRDCTADGRLRKYEVGGLGYYAVNEYFCNREPYFTFRDGQNGFLVKYRQDHGGYPGKPGVERHYVVRQNLTQAQRKSVALSIFMDVSRGFEWFQRFAGLNGLITDSGHSQEDFVSNLIGFYIAVGELSKSDAIRIAHPVGQATAEAVWRSNGPVGDSKNYSFRPHLLETGRNDASLRQCIDECAGQLRQFPSEFQTIQPLDQGAFFQEVDSGPTFRF